VQTDTRYLRRKKNDVNRREGRGGESVGVGVALGERRMRRLRAGPYLARHPTGPLFARWSGVLGGTWPNLVVDSAGQRHVSPATSANGANCEIQPPAMVQSGYEVFPVSRRALQASPIAVAECSLMIVINVLPRGRKDKSSGVNASRDRRWRLSFPSSRLRDECGPDSSTCTCAFL
jgi:hypothetical protein